MGGGQKMITVKYLMTRLAKLNPNDKLYAYEGERTGIVIISSESLRFSHFIKAAEIDKDEAE